MATLNTSDKSGEVGKKIESLLKVFMVPRKFLKIPYKKMTSAINIMILNWKAREIIIESLAW